MNLLQRLFGKTERPARRPARACLEVTKLEDRDVPTTLAAQFPGQGVWRWEDTTGWKQLTSVNATIVSAGSNGEVAAAFKGQGIYRYMDSTGWQHIGYSDPTVMSIGTGGDVVAEIPGTGVMRYNGSGSAYSGWALLTSLNADVLSINSRGDVVADFKGVGVQEYRDGHGWQQLSTWNASMLEISGPSDYVVAEFQGHGVWMNYPGTWEQMTPVDAISVSIDGGGNIAASFSSGTYRFMNGQHWVQLSAVPATAVGISSGEVAGVYGNGVFMDFDYVGWTQISSNVPSSFSYA